MRQDCTRPRPDRQQWQFWLSYVAVVTYCDSVAKAAKKARRLPVKRDYGAILEAYADPAILLSPSYRILAANRAYEAHYGRSVRAGHDYCYRVSHGYDSPCDQNGETCPLAATREGLLIGISAGAALHGAIELASRPEMQGKRIVVIFADSGERYMSLPFFAP